MCSTPQQEALADCQQNLVAPITIMNYQCNLPLAATWMQLLLSFAMIVMRNQCQSLVADLPSTPSVRVMQALR